MTFRSEDFFGFSGFAPGNFGEGFRAMAKTGAAQSRETYERLRVATEDATKTVEDTFQSAQTGTFELGLKAADALRSNADLSLSHMEALMGVRSVSELFELQSTFLRRQAELTAEQLRGMQETGRRVTEAVTRPSRQAAERAMAGFKTA